MDIFKIRSFIEEIEKNSSLCDEQNFDDRFEALDLLGFHVMDQIDQLLQKTVQTAELTLLKSRAVKLRSELEEIDNRLFNKIQENIRVKSYAGEAFKALVKEYIDFDLADNDRQQQPGYDNLDIFVNGCLCPLQAMPVQTKELEAEMVYYQKTPARVVFELVEKSHFSENDVFYDLGSGLGQVAILVNLLAGVSVKGIELEPAFCEYAKYCAAELKLPKVSFLNADARQADYSDGTVFFMFTPFIGQMLQNVLDILAKEARLRRIKIISYGPVTGQVALQSWLLLEGPKSDNMYKLCIFASL